MLRDLHQEHKHEGVEYIRSFIQQKFGILGLRNALRSIKSKCVFCRKLRAQTKVLIMADLPTEGLIISHIHLSTWAWIILVHLKSSY